MTIKVVTSSHPTHSPSQKTVETLSSTPSTKEAGIKALPSSVIRNQFLRNLPRAGLSILTDPLFAQMNLDDQKLILQNLNQATQGPLKLPKGFNSTLVDYVDSLYLPKEQPAANLEGKHLSSFYQRQASKLSENQKRLYALNIISSSEFAVQRSPEEQQDILLALQLSTHSLAQLKADLPQDRQYLLAHIGSSVPFKPKKLSASTTKEHWVQELQESPYVLSAIPSKTIKGSKDQLITLRDAQAIVNMFKGQELTIREYTITPEALSYIHEHAPQIQFLSVPVEERPANPNGPLQHELEQKWARAASSGFYQLSEQTSKRLQLPCIDTKDAEAIVNNPIPCIIRGYAITYDALEVFKRHSFAIDLESNLIITSSRSNDSPIDWNQLIKQNTMISAKQTDFDEFHQIETLKQAVEPSNTLLYIAQNNQIVDLKSAESLVPPLGTHIKLIGYTLTQEAAEYFQQKGVDTTHSTPSRTLDTTAKGREDLKGSWEREIHKNTISVFDTRLSNIFWHRNFTAIGWQLRGDNQRLITLADAQALIQVLPEQISSTSLELIDYWLTQQAVDYLKDTVVKFQEDRVVKDLDPGYEKTQLLAQQWNQQAIPLSQFREGVTGKFPLIDAEEVRKLTDTCKTLDISDQLQITGYAITDEALALLITNFPRMEFFLERNVIVTNKTLPSEPIYPNFDDLLVSQARIVGNLADEVSYNSAPIIDEENIEALIAALEQTYPYQRVTLLGYTVTGDVQSRLANYADLRFCTIIEAPIPAKSELALTTTELQDTATIPPISPQERERKWTLILQQNTDTVQGSYFVRPLSPQDKVIDLEDAQTIVQTCRDVTGDVAAIRGHTITQEAFDYLQQNAPQIDLRLNRIAPTQEALAHCEKIGKTLATLVGCVIVLAALAGTFMLIGEVAFIILAIGTLGYFLALIGKGSLAVTKPVRWVVEMLPLWIYMLELYARSLVTSSGKREEQISVAIQNSLQKLQVLWGARGSPSQALIVVKG